MNTPQTLMLAAIVLGGGGFLAYKLLSGPKKPAPFIPVSTNPYGQLLNSVGLTPAQHVVAQTALQVATPVASPLLARVTAPTTTPSGWTADHKNASGIWVNSAGVPYANYSPTGSTPAIVATAPTPTTASAAAAACEAGWEMTRAGCMRVCVGGQIRNDTTGNCEDPFSPISSAPVTPRDVGGGMFERPAAAPSEQEKAAAWSAHTDAEAPESSTTAGGSEGNYNMADLGVLYNW